jgi:hypothetical protein
MNVTDVDAEKVSEFNMDVSHIVTIGCSFTYCQGLDNKLEIGWPALVAKHFNTKLTNLAMPGIGNDTIHRVTYEYICENLKFTDSKPLVIVAWSQIDRKEEWYHEREDNHMFDDYHLVAKPQDTYSNDLYEKSYLEHYDETNYYRKTLLYKLSLKNLFENLGIPYIMTDYMPLKCSDRTDAVEKSFSEMFDLVNKNPFRIKDLGDITKWNTKLPCGHDTAESMIEVSDYVITKIKDLHPNTNFKRDIPHLKLIDFIKNSKYQQKFPEWCHFVL